MFYSSYRCSAFIPSKYDSQILVGGQIDLEWNVGGGVRGEGPKRRGEEGQHEKQQISSNAKQTVLTLSL